MADYIDYIYSTPAFKREMAKSGTSERSTSGGTGGEEDEADQNCTVISTTEDAEGSEHKGADSGDPDAEDPAFKISDWFNDLDIVDEATNAVEHQVQEELAKYNVHFPDIIPTPSEPNAAATNLLGLQDSIGDLAGDDTDLNRDVSDFIGFIDGATFRIDQESFTAVGDAFVRGDFVAQYRASANKSGSTYVGVRAGLALDLLKCDESTVSFKLYGDWTTQSSEWGGFLKWNLKWGFVSERGTTFKFAVRKFSEDVPYSKDGINPIVSVTTPIHTNVDVEVLYDPEDGSTSTAVYYKL